MSEAQVLSHVIKQPLSLAELQRVCDPCNMAIGLIKDNQKTADKMAKYLV